MPTKGGPPMTPLHALFVDLTRAYAEENYPLLPHAYTAYSTHCDGCLSEPAYGAADGAFRFAVWLAMLEPEYFMGLVALLRQITTSETVLAEQQQVMRAYVRRHPLQIVTSGMNEL